MTPLKSYKNLFKRFPAIRFASYLAVILLAIGLSALIGKRVVHKPSIKEITPNVGSPGDIMLINGENFGEARSNSFVEIAGSRITSSGYLGWSDTQIKLVLPSNVQDGLVTVNTVSGKSDPVFFANESGIPVAVKPDPSVSIPVIRSLQPGRAKVGEVITISGSNFGATRNGGQVYFTANHEKSSSSVSSENEYIAASDSDFDYEFWSDTEIQVRIPDGAAEGQFFVSTPRGNSQSANIEINFSEGKKSFSGKRTYVVQLTADITNPVYNSGAAITLYVPRPQTSARQTTAELIEVSPEPLIADDSRVIIHQRNFHDFQNGKQRFSQNFLISAWAVNSNISGKNIPRYTDSTRALYSAYTRPDSCVPSEDAAVENLKDTITGRERNPYTQALLIYNYLVKNYDISETVRTGNVNVTDLISSKSGDAYDFAILFTALCRSAGIPSLPVSGIIVENIGNDSKVRTHWWSEIYFEGYGWFPVDPALGAGLEFTAFSAIENPEEFYFGNLDSQHLAFSRGWNQIRPSVAGSKIVYRPRTYALQSIWEEASEGTSAYSSLWNDPVLLGIY